MIPETKRPTVGDRAPDFLLPNTAGQLGRFYDRFAGNRALLHVQPGPAQSAAEQSFLEDLAARAGDLADLKVTPIIVTRRASEENAALATALSFEGTIFSDPAGAITEGYAVAAKGQAQAPAVTFAIDANQRLLGVFDHGAGPVALDDCLAPIRDDVIAPTRLVQAQAPILLIPRVIDPDLCRRLIDDWQADHREGEVRLRGSTSGQTRVVSYGSKKRLDHRPSEATNQALSQMVIRRIAPEVHKAFYFSTNIIEHFCIGAYDAGRGDYFKPHRDNTTPETEPRRYAVTLNLNDDYEGGDLSFPEYGSQLYRAPVGGAVVFSCSLMHEATPVTSGRRYVALTFMIDPAAARRRAERERQAARPGAGA